MKQVAIITGASRGIGAATAKLLAASGFAVCINYNQAEKKAKAIVEEIKANHGEAVAIKADISSEQEVIHLFEAVDEQLGPVTTLINNAGVNGGISPVEEITAEKLANVFGTNVYGVFFACREAIKRMKSHGKGNIINISSEAARFGGTCIAHYAASKAAINTFTIGLAREIAPYHIRVNAISPGVIETDMHASSPSERIQTLIESLPMKRMGKAEEVAALVKWLTSDAASYVSGAIIPVTGSR